MNLRDQLREILPSCLPTSAGEAIKGTQLIEVVRRKLNQACSDATLRYHFSIMSCDPTSPIAKVDQGQGYFLRMQFLPSNGADEETGAMQPPLLGFEPDPQSIGWQHHWQKFQAFFERYCDQGTSFSFPIRHASFSHTPNDHFWLVPDAVVVRWKTGEASEHGMKLKPEMLSFEEPHFSITSLKLVLELTKENLRRHFFQCLSNSSWAHHTELIVATKIPDDVLEEVRRLSCAHQVGTACFHIPRSRLEGWSSAGIIRSMTGREFDRAFENLQVQCVSPPGRARSIDWNHLNQLRGKQQNFDELFRWIHHCTQQKEAISYLDFQRLQNQWQTSPRL